MSMLTQRITNGCAHCIIVVPDQHLLEAKSETKRFATIGAAEGTQDRICHTSTLQRQK